MNPPSVAARPYNIAAKERAQLSAAGPIPLIVVGAGSAIRRELGASVIPHDAAAILAGLLAAPFLLIFALGIAIIKAARASLGK